MTLVGMLDDDYVIELEGSLLLKNHWLWCAMPAPHESNVAPSVGIVLGGVPGVTYSGSSSVISEYRDIQMGYFWWGVTMNASECRPNDKPWGYAPKPFSVALFATATYNEDSSASAGCRRFTSPGATEGFFWVDKPEVGVGGKQPFNTCNRSLTLTEFASGPVTIPAGLGLQINSSVMRYGDEDTYWPATVASPKNYTTTLYSRDNNHIDCAVEAMCEKRYNLFTRYRLNLQVHMKRTLRYYYGSTPLDHASIDAINAALPVGSVAAGGGAGFLDPGFPYTDPILPDTIATVYDGLAALGILDNEIFPDADGIWRPSSTTNVAWVLTTAGYHPDDIMQLNLSATRRAAWSTDGDGFDMKPQTMDADIVNRYGASPVPRNWGLDWYDMRNGPAPRIVP